VSGVFGPFDKLRVSGGPERRAMPLGREGEGKGAVHPKLALNPDPPAMQSADTVVTHA